MSGTGTSTNITGVGSVGIPVADQERSLAFYVDKLGFEKRLDVPFGEGDRWLEVAPAGAATNVALVRKAADATGIDTQVRFATNDAAADHAELRDRGVVVDAELILYPVPMFAFRDPDGNRLVVVQRPPGP